MINKFQFILILLLFFNFFSFSEEISDANDSNDMKKGMEISIGLGADVNFSYVYLNYNDVNSNSQKLSLIGFDNYYVGGLNLSVPFSFLYYYPSVSVGFSLVFSPFNYNFINRTYYYKSSSSSKKEESKRLILDQNIICSFKFKSGNISNRIRFIGEIGGLFYYTIYPDIYEYRDNRYDKIYHLTDFFIGGGPYILAGYEVRHNNFSFENGFFIQGIFGRCFTYKYTEDYNLNTTYIDSYADLYSVEIGIVLRFNYIYLKELD